MSDNGLVGCPTCKGRQRLMSLGSIMANCHECNGVGWIEAPISEQDEDAYLNPEEAPILVDQPKRRGRKPKSAAGE